MEKVIEQLIEKAGKAHAACDALQFSQAACNAANAMRVVRDLAVLAKTLDAVTNNG